MIINNAARAGFLELKDGKPVATGIDGCDVFVVVRRERAKKLHGIAGAYSSLLRQPT